ncbi:hypothetical protein [Scytonema sp. NUACC26]|uniref:hypothetical protein n=1 Tax=Scytonema sp. NUACC26 TaxID=3140176 RepID=UPI0034DCB3E6
MIQPVADQTPIPERTYRRHTDPPGLWIAVALSSIILHLLLFWLLRSHGFNLLQKNSSNAVPIEFITIPAKQTPTKASLTRQPTAQKPSSVTPPKQVSPKTSAAKSSPVEDNRAIAFTDTPQTSINQNVKPKNPKPQPKKVVVKPEPKFQPDPKPTNPIPLQTQAPEPTSSPETPQNEQPESTPSPNITETPEPTPSFSPGVEDTTSPSPSPTETNSLPDNLPNTEGEVAVGKETPLEDLAPPVQSQSPTPQQGGIGIASWDIETGDVQKGTPEDLAQPIGKIQQKELNISSEEEPTPGPITFQASLLIDSSGNLTDVYIPPSISEPQSSRYREYALELFKDQKFTPASINGKKPPVSTLVVRITIQPVTSDQ